MCFLILALLSRGWTHLLFCECLWETQRKQHSFKLQENLKSFTPKVWTCCSSPSLLFVLHTRRGPGVPQGSLLGPKLFVSVPLGQISRSMGQTDVPLLCWWHSVLLMYLWWVRAWNQQLFFFRSAEFKTDPLTKLDIYSFDDLDFISSTQVRFSSQSFSP